MPASLRMADARDIVRPTVARLLGRGSLKSATAAAQGLMLPEEVTAPMANAPYRDGVRPYLPLLPLITGRHVDAFTLAGTTDEVTAYLIALREAGIDSVIVRPLPGEGVPMEDTIARLGEIWHGLATTAT
jgi:5,10-methylenetetrahydromethanopterin reductase